MTPTALSILEKKNPEISVEANVEFRLVKSCSIWSWTPVRRGARQIFLPWTLELVQTTRNV